MCRFLAYKGAPVILEKLIFAPRNSLIRQSYRANEAEEPLNGDGFGVGWYAAELDPTPAVFTSVHPAWSDRNLRSLAPKIRSSCVFAHVRAASMGDVSDANCHPFTYKHFLFMHNGSIGGFDRLKRHLRRRLSDEIYDWIRGQTDSEHFFALFLELLRRREWPQSCKGLSDALEATFCEINEIKRSLGIDEPSYLNVALTDGKVMLAMRYATHPDHKPPTLYYTEGSRYECRKGICYMEASDPSERAVLVVSEKLTNRKADWREIEPCQILTVDENLVVSVRAMPQVALGAKVETPV